MTSPQVQDTNYTARYDTVYDVVKSWLYKKGARLDKKHGNWIVLYAPNNQVVVMDSWNGQIFQAHCTETLVSNGFTLEGVFSIHTVAIPSKHHRCGDTTYDQLDEIVDIYKTLLTIPV